jgi:hypothetical protein
MDIPTPPLPLLAVETADLRFQSDRYGFENFLKQQKRRQTKICPPAKPEHPQNLLLPESPVVVDV